jgi:hypothetical protein
VYLILLISCVFLQSQYPPTNALSNIQLISSNKTPTLVPKHEGVLILVMNYTLLCAFVGGCIVCTVVYRL